MRLNGIISHEEYQQSVATINRALIPDKRLIMSIAVTGILCLGGMICLLLSALIVASIKYRHAFVFLAIAVAISLVGAIALAVSLWLFQSKRVTRMYQAISQESAKYCQRSPIPCSWHCANPLSYFGNVYPGSAVGVFLVLVIMDNYFSPIF